MVDTEIPVTFQPGEKTVYVLEGTRLLEAAAGADFVINAPCGGQAVCGKCRVVVTQGADAPTAEELSTFSPDELRAGCRLACQSAVRGPMTVLVPQTSVVGSQHQILVWSEPAAPSAGEPVLRKRYVELPVPVRGSDAPDAVRLEQALGPLAAELDLLRGLPRRLRQAEFRGTAVLAEGRLLDFEPGNTEWHAHGVAVDLGTTTLAAALLDLSTGRQVQVVSRLNPQTAFGDDVLARIVHARDRQGGLEQLRRAVVEAVDEMIGLLAAEPAVGREQIYLVALSGNTTMQQMFCGVECEPLGEVPFVPAIGKALSLPALELGLHVHPRGRAYLLPVIGGFVGGDTVAGILAADLVHASKPVLFIDIGTNGEIVLAAGGRLTAAATAAGPAFEGARISQGMRASPGAIEKVVVDGRLRIHTIGHCGPTGICGSALIDAAAELLRHGLLTPQGRLLARAELPAGLLGDLARRVVTRDNQPAFLLADAGEAAGGTPILLTQRDFRELQLAAGAIRAGIGILLAREGLTPADLDQVLVGGGFGNFIRRSNAQRIGLLPTGIERRRIRYLGNTSLAGARLVALRSAARTLAEQLAARTEHVDLSTDPAFHTAFAEAMVFPDEG